MMGGEYLYYRNVSQGTRDQVFAGDSLINLRTFLKKPNEKNCKRVASFLMEQTFMCYF